MNNVIQGNHITDQKMLLTIQSCLIFEVIEHGHIYFMLSRQIKCPNNQVTNLYSMIYLLHSIQMILICCSITFNHFTGPEWSVLRIKPQLKKLMNAYGDRRSVEINYIAFLFDGRWSSSRADTTHSLPGNHIFIFILEIYFF